MSNCPNCKKEMHRFTCEKIRTLEPVTMEAWLQNGKIAFIQYDPARHKVADLVLYRFLCPHCSHFITDNEKEAIYILTHQIINCEQRD